jgi:hypothetical protein
MNKKKIFTDQELKQMGRRTLDEVLEAIDAGNNKKARALAQRMYVESNRLHDSAMFWITGLQTYIYNNYGIEALEKAERLAHEINGKVMHKPAGEKDFRTRVEDLASGLHGHLQPMTIEEDDEKVCITMQPCGSGERIIQKGGYDVGLARIKEPGPLTYGMQDFPIYCVHCPLLEMMEVENTGDFGSVHIITEPIYHGSCRFTFYKDPTDIPEVYYTRIGKQKPAVKKESSSRVS